MVDELEKPLGIRAEKPKKTASAGGGKWLGLAGLLAGLVAIGLVGWQMITPPAPEIVVVEKIVKVEDQSQNSGTNIKVPDTDADEAGESDGESGLTEIKPSGSLSVPTPRPPKVKPQATGLAHLPDPDLVEDGATGSIPKRASDGRRAMDVYAREADTTGNFGVARIVVIVGGMGVSQTSSQAAIRKLPPTMTLAFAPYGNSLNRWMQEARKKGHEILLQLPMEPFGFPQNSPGQHTISSTYSFEENQANLHWLMSRITNYVGVMNYQGGKILADETALEPVFDEIAKRGLLFVDDGSSGNSKSRDVAKSSLLPFAGVQVQIDASRSRQDIAKQIDFLVSEAKRTGIAIGFSNGFSETIDMLAEFSQKAASLGVEITPVSAIVNDPERER